MPTELDQKQQPKRRNCKQCALEGKKDLKSVNMCEKCQVPLHVHCFKERIFCGIINYFRLEQVSFYLFCLEFLLVSFYFYLPVDYKNTTLHFYSLRFDSFTYVRFGYHIKSLNRSIT